MPLMLQLIASGLTAPFGTPGVPRWRRYSPRTADRSGSTRAAPLDGNVDPALEQQVLNVTRALQKPECIITSRQMISGDELKYRIGFLDFDLFIATDYQRAGMLPSLL